MKHVLVVDDEPAMRAGLAASFIRQGWTVETAAGTQEALGRFRSGRHALVVTDVRMPDGSGMEIMREVRRLAPATGVILLTAFASVPQAVEAMKYGACDYLVKPVSFAELELAAGRVLAKAGAASTTTSPVGESDIFRRVLAMAGRVAGSEADVLIEGESGTGKEVLARWIHERSPRKEKPFVAVNCAALPETLLESELFGYVRGAFTGALTSKPGQIEAADSGTLLLDEIGEMPLSLQPKLLRVLQEREFHRLGATQPTRVDVRVIATTNRSLSTLVEQSRFRLDLFYRLCVVPLTLPPLRERGAADIHALARLFLERYGPKDRNVCLAHEFAERLARHRWPGNVRELENCIRRALVLSPSDTISADLPPEERTDIRSTVEPGTTLEELERDLLVRTLEATGGNRSRAAAIIGISLRTVRNKIRQYGLPPRIYAAH